MDFQNKVALVTGAARGIGKAVARIFLENGAKVCICDIDIDEGTKTLQEFKKEFGENRIIFVKCDVSKAIEYEAAYSECENEFNGLDILVNNAGIVSNELKSLEGVNFEGPVRGTELAIKKMGKHNGGKGGIVVNIASISGMLPFPVLPYYAALKAAVIHFSRIIGGKFHHGYHGVSVFCLCPGGVNTDLSSGDILERTAYNEFVAEIIMDIKKNVKLIEPKEVAEALIRLINDNKSGEAAVIDKDAGFIYVPPSLDNSTLGLEDI